MIQPSHTAMHLLPSPLKGRLRGEIRGREGAVTVTS